MVTLGKSLTYIQLYSPSSVNWYQLTVVILRPENQGFLAESKVYDTTSYVGCLQRSATDPVVLRTVEPHTTHYRNRFHHGVTLQQLQMFSRP